MLLAAVASAGTHCCTQSSSCTAANDKERDLSVEAFTPFIAKSFSFCLRHPTHQHQPPPAKTGHSLHCRSSSVVCVYPHPLKTHTTIKLHKSATPSQSICCGRATTTRLPPKLSSSPDNHASPRFSAMVDIDMVDDASAAYRLPPRPSSSHDGDTPRAPTVTSPRFGFYG